MFHLSSRYYPRATFTGPKDVVLSVSFSVNSEYLACAGYTGVSVWEIETGKLITVPSKYATTKDPKYMQSASTWVYFEGVGKHMVLLGGMKGDLVSLAIRTADKGFEQTKQAPTSNSAMQITSVQVRDPSVSSGLYARVAIGCCDESVSVWKLASTGEFTQIFSTSMAPNFLPKAVHLVKSLKNVYVYDLAGKMALLQKDGHIVWNKATGIDQILAVALDSSTDRLFIHTGTNIQVLTFSELKHQKTIGLSAPLVVAFPKQLAFAEGCTRLVSGTDSGHAAVYRINNGETVLEQKLEYPNGGLVQTVACSAGSRWNYIAIAGTTQGQPSNVLLFRKKRQSTFFNLKFPTWSILTMWKLVIILVTVVLICSAHIYRSSILKWYYSNPGLASSAPLSDAYQGILTTATTTTTTATITTTTTTPTGTSAPDRISLSDTLILTASAPPVGFKPPYLNEYHDIVRRLRAHLDDLDESRRTRVSGSTSDDPSSTRPSPRQGASSSRGDSSPDVEETFGEQVSDPRSVRADMETNPVQRESYDGGQTHHAGEVGSFGDSGVPKSLDGRLTYRKDAELENREDAREEVVVHA
ncbi:hypothetical protein V5O48_012687 [Marasmius crinis-equi]|uniref:WD40 repeat-like protein n=1 Tax=Marasmius crinis-equi TaxID=585013 RepID=A0ABR3F270_9AGAR